MVNGKKYDVYDVQVYVRIVGAYIDVYIRIYVCIIYICIYIIIMLSSRGAAKIYVVQTIRLRQSRRLKAILTLTEKTGPGYELSAICTVGPTPRIPRAKTIRAPVRCIGTIYNYCRAERTVHTSCIHRCKRRVIRIRT